MPSSGEPHSQPCIVLPKYTVASMAYQGRGKGGETVAKEKCCSSEFWDLFQTFSQLLN